MTHRRPTWLLLASFSAAAALAISQPGHASEGDSAEPIDCRKHRACTVQGRCTLKGASCVAVDSSDCLRSEQCASEGLCAALDGICVALTDAHCAQSAVCEYDERCEARANGCEVKRPEVAPTTVPVGPQQLRFSFETPKPPDRKKRYSKPMMGLGIAAISVGAVMAAIGGVLMSGDRRKPDDSHETAAFGVLIPGIVVAAAGVPLTVVGARKVRDSDATAVPQIRISHTGGTLRWAF